MRKVVTAQGIFNHIYKFITRQGRASASTSPVIGNRCWYRCAAPDGKVLACAAGCLLTDAEAAKLEEGLGWYANVNLVPARFAPFERLIKDCQLAHDQSAATGDGFLPAFHRHMDRVARFYGLTVPVL